MEKLNELLRAYAQSIRRDDGTAFIHADAIRALFDDQAAEPKGMTEEQREAILMAIGGHRYGSSVRDPKYADALRALLAKGE